MMTLHAAKGLDFPSFANRDGEDILRIAQPRNLTSRRTRGYCCVGSA